MAYSPKLKKGDTAPDFVLKDQNDKEWKLSDLKGKKVLLSWHPLAWTGVCAEQMKSLEEHQNTFEKLNVIVFGLSVDHAPCKKAWASSLGIEKTSLLCDFWPHGGVAKTFDCFIEKAGISGRCNILIDEEGQIIHYQVYDIPQLPDIDEIIKVCEG